MEAYDQRYDVAIYTTVERPEFLLYVIQVLFGIIVKIHTLFLRLLWRHLFPKRRNRVSSMCSLFTSLFISRSGFLLMSSKLFLVQFQLSALSLPWYKFFLCVFVLINLGIHLIFTVLN